MSILNWPVGKERPLLQQIKQEHHIDVFMIRLQKQSRSSLFQAIHLDYMPLIKKWNWQEETLITLKFSTLKTMKNSQD
jgi:hypothetical protein